MLFDSDGRRIRRVIGYFREFRRTDGSTPENDISLVGQQVDPEIDEVFEDQSERVTPILPAGDRGHGNRTPAPQAE